MQGIDTALKTYGLLFVIGFFIASLIWLASKIVAKKS